MALLAGRYELAETLGSGGMARVFAAYDRVLDRRVAIKLIHEGFTSDPTSHERLLREARAAAGLHHPNTVSVFDVGEDAGRPFIVMELVEGPSLADRLRARGALSVAESVAIADAVLAGLGAAHERGLVHRDVKPANILLPVVGGVKLADFGIAKALAGTAAQLTATGLFLGTPRYLAPEVAAGRDATPAGDLYSLGVVLYECLAGHTPFEADTPIAEALAHQRDPVPPLTAVATHLPPGLTAVVERALAKDPAARFSDAADMRSALADVGGYAAAHAAAGGTRIMTPPTRALQTPQNGQGTPWWRRPWVVLGGLAALIVVVGLAIVLTRGGADTPDQPPVGQGGETEAPATPPEQPPTQEPAAPEPQDEQEQVVSDLDALISDLSDDPNAAGERGETLLDELTTIRDERNPDKRAEKARKLIKETASWLDEGEIGDAIGRRAITVLEPEGRPDDPALTDTSTLFADVALATREWGEKAGDLLSDLDDLLGGKPKDRAEDADDLIEDIEDWIDDGELNAELGRRALDVLRPLARS